MPEMRFSLADRGLTFRRRCNFSFLCKRCRRRVARASWEVGSGEVGRRWRGLWRTLSVKMAEAASGVWAWRRMVWAGWMVDDIVAMPWILYVSSSKLE